MFLVYIDDLSKYSSLLNMATASRTEDYKHEYKARDGRPEKNQEVWRGRTVYRKDHSL